MKLKNILINSLLVGLYAIPSYAQFNTIGSPVIRKDVSSNTLDEMRCDSIFANKRMPLDSNKAHGILEYNKYVAYPLKSVHISSGFGIRRHPISHKYVLHNGIDLHARHENVLSMLPGRVLRVGYDNRSGKYVTVQTANYTVSYCHLSEQYVKTNDYLHAGEPLGLTGNTGASTGEHLHLTTKKDGKAFDPTILLNYVKNNK